MEPIEIDIFSHLFPKSKHITSLYYLATKKAFIIKILKIILIIVDFISFFGYLLITSFSMDTIELLIALIIVNLTAFRFGSLCYFIDRCRYMPLKKRGEKVYFDSHKLTIKRPKMIIPYKYISYIYESEEDILIVFNFCVFLGIRTFIIPKNTLSLESLTLLTSTLKKFINSKNYKIIN